VRRQLRRACDIVSERRAEIERLVAALLERDTLGSAEIKACFEPSRELPTAVPGDQTSC
jgi:cell division protease FtsH